MKYLVIFALALALVLSACSSTNSTGIDDIQKNPANYTNKTITIIGTLSTELAPSSAEHFNYYLVQYHNYQLKLDCKGHYTQLTKNVRYQATGTLTFNNATNEYSLKCSEDIVER
jgi:hypothetical protein